MMVNTELYQKHQFMKNLQNYRKSLQKNEIDPSENVTSVNTNDETVENHNTETVLENTDVKRTKVCYRQIHLEDQVELESSK
ncbi:hypothetical protein DPMN_166399 [Dreissena polymorpha]|uniref:Uncharacterized protein n=1 Tax=Dreissena polymorpha TaxID=45954 RepID=A0A9D4EYW6_DREPO|nr:hypothetical protein DPMN_166399 [Dreissena polymorpha]